jgi:prepilin-type N-terminal cleavage/methylation domain-containing protein
MKKAFTLLELVFVIVVIAILAVIIIPTVKTNPVREAAIQLVSHIRYTQHLAMIDDRFDAVDTKWYMGMWQIRFTPGNVSSDWGIAYVVYSDRSHTEHPEKSEIAKDPLSGLYIDGGVVNNNYGDSELLSSANLGKAYGIKDIDFSSSCSYYSSKRITFDHLGRPIKGAISSPASSDTLVKALKFMTQTCEITICSVADCSVASNDEKVTILIEPETGYTHIQ